jgi:hypothetical protein
MTNRSSELRPALVAVLDQAEAAAAEGARMITAIAERVPGRLISAVPGPVARALIRRLTVRAEAGQLSLCPHLPERAPAPSFWPVWAPGRLRCSPCTEVASRRIRGTAADRQCDHCRRRVRVIYPAAVQLPAVVVDLPGLLAASGPVTVLYGLCPACHEADEVGLALVRA